MDREMYEKMTGQPDVLDEIVLEGLKAVLIEERDSSFREIDKTLRGDPIEQPPFELGMPRQSFFQIRLGLPKARQILSVIKVAESMYGRRARFHDCELGALRRKWARYCQALTAR